MYGLVRFRVRREGFRKHAHLPMEVAAALGISAGAAIWLVRDVVNLAARHPRLWQAAQAGSFPLWRARTIAQVVEAAGLGHDEALQVDLETAAAVGRIGWRRLINKVRAAMLQVAPGKLRRQAEKSQAARSLSVAGRASVLVRVLRTAPDRSGDRKAADPGWA